MSGMKISVIIPGTPDGFRVFAVTTGEYVGDRDRTYLAEGEFNGQNPFEKIAKLEGETEWTPEEILNWLIDEVGVDGAEKLLQEYKNNRLPGSWG